MRHKPLLHGSDGSEPRRLLLLVALLLASMAAAQTKPAADLILTHAKVWTVDKSRPTAEAVAVLGERIVAAGTSAEVAAWQGPATRVIDAGGKLLLPGFNDAHVHFVSGGMQLDNVDLKDADTPEELARRVGERAAATPKGEWILGATGTTSAGLRLRCLARR